MTRYFQFFVMSLLLGSFFLLTGCGKPKFHTLNGETMGTTWQVVLQTKEKNLEEIKPAIDQKLETVNQSMSTYIDDSEISRFNALETGQSMEASKDFLAVLTLAKSIYEQSGGAFDPTVATLVDLWGFGGGSNKSSAMTPPLDEAISKALKKTGMNQVLIDGQTVTKKGNVHLDFSGIAKGYGVDKVAQLLRDHDVNNFLVEIGGEIATQGISPRAGDWRVAITAPKSLESQITRVELQDANLATSGNYRNYFDHEGKRYSHTIDPATGYPVTHTLSSVTVIAESVAAADAWATALLVLGVDKGLEVATDNSLAVYMIYNDGEGFKLKYTDAMKAYFPGTKNP